MLNDFLSVLLGGSFFFIPLSKHTVVVEGGSVVMGGKVLASVTNGWVVVVDMRTFEDATLEESTPLLGLKGSRFEGGTIGLKPPSLPGNIGTNPPKSCHTILKFLRPQVMDVTLII